MPLFTRAPFEEEVELVTNENNLTEDWTLILDICDKTVNYHEGPQFCLQAIVKRLNHGVPAVVMQAITLLDACVNNCGRRFHLQVSSRYFSNEAQKLLPKMHPAAADKFKKLLQKWAEKEFKDDPELCLIPSLYYKLKSEGVKFPTEILEPAKKPAISLDPDVVNSQEEEDDIVKAIELSLKDTGKHNFVLRDSALAGGANNTSLSDTMSGPVKVQALYDFEAAEENELTIKAGEIIIILDDKSSDSWWKGANHKGEGLFPSNFVTKDLDAPVEVLDEHEEIQPESSETMTPDASITIDENKILMAINWLTEADPTGEFPDPDEMIVLERNCQAMAPLIEENLQKIDKRLALLNSLNKELVDSLATFYKLTRGSTNISSYYGNNFSTVSENIQPTDNSSAKIMLDSYCGGQNIHMSGPYLSPSERTFVPHSICSEQSVYNYSNSQQQTTTLPSGKTEHLNQPDQNSEVSSTEEAQATLSKPPSNHQDDAEHKSAAEATVFTEKSADTAVQRTFFPQNVPNFVHVPQGAPTNYIQYPSNAIYSTWYPVTHTPTMNPACIEIPVSCYNSGLVVPPHLTSLNVPSVIKHQHSKTISQQEVINSNGTSAKTVDCKPINVMDSYVSDLHSCDIVLPIRNNTAKSPEADTPVPSDS